jgi:hypothetical protein
MATTRDQEEQDKRIELMSKQFEQAQINIDRMRQEIRTDTRKFAVQAIIAAAALLAAGVAIGRFLLPGHGG